MSLLRLNHFQLPQRRCFRCGSIHTHLSLISPGNLWRLPLAVLTGLFLRPPMGIVMRCEDCSHRRVYSINARER